MRSAFFAGGIRGITIVVLIALSACGADAGKSLRYAFAPEAQAQLDAIDQAPGAADLRAKGCAQAIIVDYARTDPGNKTVNVICKAGDAPPACDELARAYVQAVPGNASKLNVTAYASGQMTPSCTRGYNASGAPI